MKYKIGIYFPVGILLVLCFQNCGGGFDTASSHNLKASDSVPKNSIQDDSQTGIDNSESIVPPKIQEIDKSEVFFSKDLRVLGIGQSNMERYFSRNGELKTYFENNMETRLPGVFGSIEFLSKAAGGSALLKENTPRPEASWVDYSGEELRPAPLLEAAINEIQIGIESEKPINFFLWAQGERDARQLAGDIAEIANKDVEIQKFKERYKKAMVYLINLVKKSAGNTKIAFGFQGLGRFVNSPSDRDRYTFLLIREIQMEIAAEMAQVFILADTYDAEMSDSLHMSQGSKQVTLDRMVENIARLYSDKPIERGLFVESASINNRRDQISIVFSEKPETLGKSSHLLFTVTSKNLDGLVSPSSMRAIENRNYILEFDSPLVEGLNILAMTLGQIEDPEKPEASLSETGIFINNSRQLPLQPQTIAID